MVHNNNIFSINTLCPTIRLARANNSFPPQLTYMVKPQEEKWTDRFCASHHTITVTSYKCIGSATKLSVKTRRPHHTCQSWMKIFSTKFSFTDSELQYQPHSHRRRRDRGCWSSLLVIVVYSAPFIRLQTSSPLPAFRDLNE